MSARPGRPRGSRTLRRLPVVTVPPQCPECGYTLPSSGRTVRVRPVPTGHAPAGEAVNRVVVDAETKRWARVALDRMLPAELGGG